MTPLPQDVAGTLDSIRAESFATDADRHEAMEAARRLVARLETPVERAVALTWGVPGLLASIKVCQDLGVWEKWAEKEGRGEMEGPQTLEAILDTCNVPVEPNLMRRLLRHIAASHALEETAVDEWNLTPFTAAMGKPAEHVDQVFSFALDVMPTFLHLPSFLATHGYKEPLDPATWDNFTDVFGRAFFDHLKADAAAGASFAGLMTGWRDYKLDWTEVYDTTELVSGADLSSASAPPLLVDVGGMHGRDAARLLARHPELPASARLVVQDLPEVVSAHDDDDDDDDDQEQQDPRLSRMAYDFFTPQPLAGARAYFFHAVPHDWPDAECARILANARAAMRRGYSRLLVYEIVIPARGASDAMTTLDLLLMSWLSGLERSEAQWRALLGGLGFRIVSISRHPRAVESVIEAVCI